MKKILLLIIAGFIAYLPTIGQILSFKINNDVSSITGTEHDVKITKNGKTKKAYETIEIINYNYKGMLLEDAQAQKKLLLDELYNNSMGTDGNPPLGNDSVVAKSNRIQELSSDISVLTAARDSLLYLYAKDYLSYKKVSVLKFGPLRSRAFFDMVYGNGGKTFRALGNAGLSFGNQSASIYSEIVSGNLGLFRVSLGTMISKSGSNDSTAQTEEAYQRLVNYGGNTVLNFEYPLAYLHNYNNQYNFISRFIAKGTADFPAFGTDTSKWAGSASFGIDFYGDAATSNNQLRFFFNFNANMIYGTNVFKNNLNVSKNKFSFGQLSVGLVFLNNFKVSFMIATLSSEKSLKNKDVIAGGQVLR